MTAQKALAKVKAWIEEENPRLNVAFGNKNNLKVGGPNLMQRFPVTLYAPSWLVLLNHAEEIREFIENNAEALDWGKFNDE